MKRFWAKKSGIAAVMALFIVLLALHSSVAFAESWSFVDGDGTDGINYDATKNGGNPRLVDFDGTLFAAWSESIGSTSQIRVKKYDSGAWVTGDNNTPLNKDTTKDSSNPYLYVFNNELYATWQELGPTSYWQLRVAKFDGTSWSRIDGDGTSGINANSTTNARNPKFIAYNSTLYLFWDETGGNGINQIRVKKYGGGSTWNTADGSAALNQDTTHAGQAPVAAVYGGKLYLAWQENNSSSINQLRVKSFDGTSWSFVDGGGVSGLNLDDTMRANAPYLEVYNGNLYVAWCEQSTKTQLHVKKYDGTSWTSVDGGVQASGLNQNTNFDAYQVRMAVFDGNLYATWHEGSPNYHVRVKKYDGTTWESVDGNSTKGLNKNTSNSATYGHLVVFDNSLYEVFLESNGVNQVRVVLMGPSNYAPVAGSVSFTGTLKVGNTLTGTYVYSDTESDLEGITTFKWYTADDAAGTGKAVISGATSDTLVLTGAEADKYIIFEVTPAATTGTLAGTPATYTSASAVVSNLGPTASAVSFTGTLKENNMLTGTYTYGDEESDAEGVTTYQWYTANDVTGSGKLAISGATSDTFMLTHAEVGKYIIFEVTPTATQGTLTGTPGTATSPVAVAANAAPVASAVGFTGTLKENNTLTGTYTYSDEENDAKGTPTYQWYTANDAAGTGKSAITGATGTALNLTSAEVGKYIIFEVTPVATSGTLSGTPTTYTSPSAVQANSAPVASNVSISGALMLNITLTGSYAYADADGDIDSGTTFQWYTADDAIGSNKTAISGATTKTLKLQAAQYGKFIIFEVTPKAASGTTPGVVAASSAYGAVGVLKGDANGDGLITPADALIVTKFSQGKITLTDEQKKALDMDNDNDVDAADAQLILNIYLGKGV